MTPRSLQTGAVRFSYPDGNEVLRIDSLAIRKGEVTVVTGENGSGKTTLLKILAGLLEPDDGAGPELRAIAADSVYLHQAPYLFRGSVLHNMKMVAPGTDEPLIASVLESLGLGEFQRRQARNLSGGETKRVALARCLLSNTALLLMDEPTAHVDSSSATLIEQVCRDQAEKGRAVVVTSHRGGFGYRIADRIVDLADGRLRDSQLNLMKGRVNREENGHMRFLSMNTGFRVPIMDGEFRVAVLDGKDILVSLHPLDSSARNCLPGTLTDLVRISTDMFSVSVNCGVTLRTTVTDSSVNDLRLEVGKTIYATFKASSVALY